MKLLVFAHTPPPLHGQSYMVESMLLGFGGDQRSSALRRSGNRGASSHSIRCYHVNVQLSNELKDVGVFDFRKLLRITRFCLEAIWCRFRYNVDTFYYIPASPKRIALYRDWIVLALCRPFFRQLVLHWHACGLMTWLSKEGSQWERRVTSMLLGKADLALCLSNSTSEDARELKTSHLVIVANGIEDPCPHFAETILLERHARFAERQSYLQRKSGPGTNCEYRVLFFGACTRAKGVFNAIEAVQLANGELDTRGIAMRMHLTIAGSFLTKDEEQEFERIRGKSKAIAFVGFAGPEMKDELLRANDCFCFPTSYHAEGQPISLIEAMAYGLAIVTTNWRGIPDLLPPGISTVEIRDSRAIAHALIAAAQEDHSTRMRAHFVGRFTRNDYLRNLEAAFNSLNADDKDDPKR